MPQMPYSKPFILIIISFIAAAQLCAATDHIVGAHLGWNPNINYSSWANNQTFYVNDFISFRYHKFTYNVFEVNETGYDNCTIEGAAGNWTSGKDFILLTEAKRYYFICNGFCFSGMKISVVVHSLPSPPPSSTHYSAEIKSPGSSGSSVLLAGGLSGVLAIVIAFSLSWISL